MKLCSFLVSYSRLIHDNHISRSPPCTYVFMLGCMYHCVIRNGRPTRHDKTEQGERRLTEMAHQI